MKNVPVNSSIRRILQYYCFLIEQCTIEPIIPEGFDVELNKTTEVFQQLISSMHQPISSHKYLTEVNDRTGLLAKLFEHFNLISYLALVKLRSQVSSLRTPSLLNRRLLPMPIFGDKLDNSPPLINVQRELVKEFSLND